MKFVSLFVLLFVASAVYAVNEKVVVCYYGTWATYRWGLGQFDVENIDPLLCTHLIYAFVGIDSQGTVISLDSDLDLSERRHNFKKFNELKNVNPNLKTILAVGGWSQGSGKFSVMVASASLRRNFIDSALKMLQDYGFDGLDLDWEYPNRRDTVYGKADIDNFTQLTKELREEFDKYGLLLTAAVSSVEVAASQSYDIPSISKYVDYINLMAYDLYGAWDPVTGHNAPLYAGDGDENADQSALLTVDNAVKYWLKEGCPPEKLVLGVPFYGQTFTLSNPNAYGVRASASGAGIAGPFTATNGHIGYNEFCSKLQTESWAVYRDEQAKVPYAVKGSDWVSYDDPEAMKAKVEYALSHNLAGIMMWSIETDDFNNVCGEGNFPLLTAINDALYGDGSPADTTTTSTTTTKAPEDTTTTTKATSVATDTTSTTETTVTISLAPSEDELCQEVGFVSNPEDCATYYVCIQDALGGLQPVKFDCPATLYWDQKHLYCNYKEQVPC